jgi:hypothetical protein
MRYHCAVNVSAPPREKRGYGAELQDRSIFFQSDDSRWKVGGQNHWSWNPSTKGKAKRRKGVHRPKVKLWRPCVDSLADAFVDFNPYGHIAK